MAGATTDRGSAPWPEGLAQDRRRVVARLARSLGLNHLALAEDAVQTATLRALERWPLDGVPDAPAAWLFRVARHAAIDAATARGLGRSPRTSFSRVHACSGSGIPVGRRSSSPHASSTHATRSNSSSCATSRSLSSSR